MIKIESVILDSREALWDMSKVKPVTFGFSEKQVIWEMWMHISAYSAEKI